MSEDAGPIDAVPVRHPGRWVALVVIAIVFAMIISSFVTNPRWDWPFAFQVMNYSPVLEGLVKGTIIATIGSMLIGVTLAIIVYGLSFRWILDPSTTTQGTMLAVLIAGLTLMGLTFGPMSAVLPELFATNVRYTGSGISYNFASILGAAIAPKAPSDSTARAPQTASRIWIAFTPEA